MVLAFFVGGIVTLIAILFLLVLNKRSGQSKADEKFPIKKRFYTMEEVKRHATPEESVWIVVRYGEEQRVYDITEYAEGHPGGDVIYDSAGTDATEKFNGPQHPPTVHDLITEYHIGWIGEQEDDDDEDEKKKVV